MEKEAANPLEPVVKKIEEAGYTVEQVFVLFDDNGDELLTLNEIKDGIRNQDIDLTDAELKEFLTIVDKNSDGVLTLEEFIDCLVPKVESQKEYKAIMQDINIDDPLILEERILDLKYRVKYLDKELHVLREANGEAGGMSYKDLVKQKMRGPMQKKYADKIKLLEGRLTDKMKTTFGFKMEVEAKINENLLAKDKVNQDYYDLQRQKDRLVNEHTMRLDQIMQHVNDLDLRLNEHTQFCLQLKSEREQIREEINRH